MDPQELTNRGDGEIPNDTDVDINKYSGLDEFSQYIIEYIEEIEMSRTKARHRWGGHYQKFMIRENSYQLARELFYRDNKDMFYGLSQLIYACLQGDLDLIIDLCSNIGNAPAPLASTTDDFLTEYPKMMKKLALEARIVDDEGSLKNQFFAPFSGPQKSCQ